MLTPFTGRLTAFRRLSPYAGKVSQVKLNIGGNAERELDSLVERGTKGDKAWEQTERLHELYEAIRLGAGSFLTAEYKMCAYFVVVATPLIGYLIARGADRQSGTLSAISFVVGAATSMISGYIGMSASHALNGYPLNPRTPWTSVARSAVAGARLSRAPRRSCRVFERALHGRCDQVSAAWVD